MDLHSYRDEYIQERVHRDLDPVLAFIGGRKVEQPLRAFRWLNAFGKDRFSGDFPSLALPSDEREHQRSAIRAGNFVSAAAIHAHAQYDDFQRAASHAAKTRHYIQEAKKYVPALQVEPVDLVQVR